MSAEAITMKNRICYIFLFFAIFFGLPTNGYAMMRHSIIERDTTSCVVIYFDSNENRVDSLYSGNREAVTALDSLFSDCYEAGLISSIVVSTFVSPDGNADLNNRLAAKRNESVKEFLLQRYPFVDAIQIEFHSRGEDWLELGRLVTADSQIPNREEVLMLIEYHHDDFEKQEQLLRKLNGGMPYRYMVRRIFPKLRRSEIAVIKSVPEAAQKVVNPEAAALVETVSAHEPEQAEKSEKNEMEITAAADTKSTKERTTVLAIKNNLLYDLALAPNIEVEVPVGKRWSFNAEYKCPWWLNSSSEFCYQLLSGGVEARYWMGNRQKRDRLTGHFLGLYAEGGVYDFQFGGDGYQGKYYGASGLTYGYTRQVARHLSLEFSLGVGYLTTEYRKYTPYEGDIVWTKSGRYNFFGPTKAKVSLVWLIKTKK